MLLTETRTQWGLWIYRLLLILGVTLTLAGILYYCAYNFFNIPPFMKFTSLMALFTVAIAGTWFAKNPLIKELSLFAGVFLIGIFWAVFGQIYQTGADSYLLFLIWGIMALPFILLEPKASLMALGCVIASICMGLYKTQGAFPFNLSNESITIPMVALPSALLLLKNNPRWFKLFLLTLALAVATSVVFDWAFNSFFKEVQMNIYFFIAFGFSLFLAWVYRYKIYDIPAFSLALLALVLDVHFIMIKQFIDAKLYLGGLFLGGIVSICIFAMAIMILKSAYKAGSKTHD